jgi:hypothetical protein
MTESAPSETNYELTETEQLAVRIAAALTGVSEEICTSIVSGKDSPLSISGNVAAVDWTALIPLIMEIMEMLLGEYCPTLRLASIKNPRPLQRVRFKRRVVMPVMADYPTIEFSARNVADVFISQCRGEPDTVIEAVYAEVKSPEI